MVKALSITFQQCYSALPRSFVKGPLKRDFLDIYLITFFGVPKFNNKLSLLRRDAISFSDGIISGTKNFFSIFFFFWILKI